MNITKLLKDEFPTITLFLFTPELKTLVETMPITDETTNEEIFNAIAPTNKIDYEIKDYDDFIGIFDLSTDEILQMFGLSKIEFDAEHPCDLLCDKTLWLINKEIFDILPNGIKVMTLIGEYEELVKEDFNELINKMPVLPIGFIK